MKICKCGHGFMSHCLKNKNGVITLKGPGPWTPLNCVLCECKKFEESSK